LGISCTSLHAHPGLIAEQIGDVADDLLFNLLRGNDGDGTGNIFQLLFHPGAADDHDFIGFLVCGESGGDQPGRHGEGYQGGVLLCATAKSL
jgi:hypothetical protein